MIDSLIFAAVNLIFFLVGYFAGRGTLQDKVKDIIKAKNKTSAGGVATPLEPRELDKKRSRAILDKFQ